MKHILLFGDSNTWGYNGETFTRFPFETRWAGRLQTALWPDYRIIDEGFRGRTTAFDDSLEPGRSGLSMFPQLLNTHDPLDMVVILLGTNDTKTRFQASAAEIAKGAGLLVHTAHSPDWWGGSKTPKVLLVSPPHIRADRAAVACTGSMFDKSSETKGLLLPALLSRVSDELHCSFFDAGECCQTCDADGVHLDAQGHKKFADAMIALIPKLLAD